MCNYSELKSLQQLSVVFYCGKEFNRKPIFKDQSSRGQGNVFSSQLEDWLKKILFTAQPTKSICFSDNLLHALLNLTYVVSKFLQSQEIQLVFLLSVQKRLCWGKIGTLQLQNEKK